MKNFKTILLAILNVLAYVSMLGVNYLAIALPLGGISTKELSDQYNTLLTPSGITFSIWGIIYLLLGFFLIAQLRQAFQTKTLRPPSIRIGGKFIYSCLLNAAWLVAWHYQYIALSVLIMILLLGTLLTIYVRLGKLPVNQSLYYKCAYHIPFSVYLAWICVASCVNIASFLVAIEWDAWIFTPTFWTIIILIIIGLLGLVIMSRRQDDAFIIVLIWAVAGILTQQIETATVGIPIKMIALLVIIVLTFSLLYRKSLWRFRAKPKSI